MDALLVCSHIASLGKAFIALIALIRFLARMNTQVHGQFAFLCKAFITVAAIVEPVT